MHLLRSKYSDLGPKKLAAHIDRKPEAIKAKAYKIGLIVGDLENYVPLGYIASETGVHMVSVRERAKASGFARHTQSNRILVPLVWAEAYIRSAKRSQEADELINHYYTVEKVAKLFDIHPSSLRKWLVGGREKGSQIISRIKVVVTSGRHNRRYLFEPYGVEKEAKRYHDERLAKTRVKS